MIREKCVVCCVLCEEFRGVGVCEGKVDDAG